jgi:hypothetical protein
MQPILYTAIFGNKDELIEDHRGVDDWRIICFTDNANLRADRTEVVRVPRICKDPVRCARYYKLLPHEHLPSAPYSVWIDGNVRITSDHFAAQVDDWLGHAPMAVLDHPRRDCVYREAERVIELGKDHPGVVRQQIKAYRAMGVPEHLGLHTNSVVCRRHDDPEVQRLCNAWWDILVDYSRRDQLSMDVARWLTGCSVTTIPFSKDPAPTWLTVTDHKIAADFGTSASVLNRLAGRGRRIRQDVMRRLVRRQP